MPSLTIHLRNKVLFVSFVIIFFITLVFGYFLAKHKPLENDELFTHINSVERLSYLGIITSKIPEGNVSPLFYLTQKAFLQWYGFRLPFEWNGDWFVTDLKSQVILRILPNVFMSLSIALVFYFFARLYSVWVGVYGACVGASSFMTLAYWAVARPYALWYLLTTVQVLFFLYLLLEEAPRKKLVWKALVVNHFLLAFTVTFAAVQIGAVSLMLLFCKKHNLKDYGLLTILPILICIAYYFATPKYSFYFTDNAIQLISASFPKERIAQVLALGGVLCGSVFLKGNGHFVKWYKDSRIVFLIFTGLMLIFTLALLAIFYFKAQGKSEGFPLSNRYFIYLTPIGVIATIFFTAEAWRALAGKMWWRVGVAGLALGLLLFRINWSWLLVRAFYSL